MTEREKLAADITSLLLPKSQLPPDVAEAAYFDVRQNATPDSALVGSINRARQQGEVASRKARMRADSRGEL
jgi:hypothetical protein